MRTSCLLVVVSVFTLSAAPALALPVWGFDNGTEFEISATDNGGTSYGSIDAALQAGTTAGSGSKSTALFTGTFTGIDETITLYDLTFSGTGSNSMTWNAGLHAFGNRDSANFDAAIVNVSVTTTGAGDRGVSWLQNAGSERRAELSVANVTFNTTGDGIYLWGGAQANSYSADLSLDVSNSTLVSSAGAGILTRSGKNYPTAAGYTGEGFVTVTDTQIEAFTAGIVLDTSRRTATNSLIIERSRITSNNPASTDDGVRVQQNYGAGDAPLILVDSLVAGFDTGVSSRSPATTNTLGQSLLLDNNTIVENTTGVAIYLGIGQNNNYDTLEAVLVNNIIAGSTTGLDLRASGGDFGGTAVLNLAGDNNALFANTDDVTVTIPEYGAVNQNDNGRITPGYTLIQAFVDPGSGDYRLLNTATALIDTGELLSGAELGGFIGYLDANNNGTYDDGTDFVIWTDGSATPTANTWLVLLDANLDSDVDRLVGSHPDIGAFEFTEVPEPATLALLGLGGLALAGRACRRRRR